MEALWDQTAPLLRLPEMALGSGASLKSGKQLQTQSTGRQQGLGEKVSNFLIRLGFSLLSLMIGFKRDLGGFHQKPVQIKLVLGNASNKHRWPREEHGRENTW